MWIVFSVAITELHYLCRAGRHTVSEILRRYFPISAEYLRWGCISRWKGLLLQGNPSDTTAARHTLYILHMHINILYCAFFCCVWNVEALFETLPQGVQLLSDRLHLCGGLQVALFRLFCKQRWACASMTSLFLKSLQDWYCFLICCVCCRGDHGPTAKCDSRPLLYPNYPYELRSCGSP